MFPIRDHNPSHSAAYVTWALIAANLVVFVASMPWGGNMVMIWETWPLYPGAVTHGYLLGGLFTYMFVHAGFAHIAGNMLFLWIFGDNLEDELGHFGFAVFYLATGLAAAAAQILAEPNSAAPMVGASGAIAGVMGGYLLLFPRAKVDVLFIFGFFFKVFAIPAWVVLGVWFVIQLFSGSTAGAADIGVAYWAHVGGFAMGVLLTLPVWLRRGGASFWARTHGQPDHAATNYPTRIPIVRRRR